MPLCKLSLSILFFFSPLTLALGQTKAIAERLGYPADSKLLIIHADDLAVAHSEDAASFDALDRNAVTSASIMVPCPWLNEVAAYAKAHPDADLVQVPLQVGRVLVDPVRSRSLQFVLDVAAREQSHAQCSRPAGSQPPESEGRHQSNWPARPESCPQSPSPAASIARVGTTGLGQLNRNFAIRGLTGCTLRDPRIGRLSHESANRRIDQLALSPAPVLQNGC